MSDCGGFGLNLCEGFSCLGRRSAGTELRARHKDNERSRTCTRIAVGALGPASVLSGAALQITETRHVFSNLLQRCGAVNKNRSGVGFATLNDGKVNFGLGENENR